MKIRILPILMVLLLLLSGCTISSIITEYPPISRATMAEWADVIVTGQFVREGWSRKEDGSIYKNYTFEVDQVFKGEPGETIKIRIEGGRYWFDTLEADTPPQLKRTCMVFLRQLSDGKRYAILQDEKLYYNAEENIWGGGVNAISNEGDVMSHILAMDE